MKKILITGADSYIGTSFEKYISENFSEDYTVDTVDMIGDNWREKDFSKYDTIFHVAGIAHIKETKENAEIYYKVNRDIAIETAKKAKYEGVKQFVFLSTMSVYGIETGVITKETLPCPKNNYGKSKLQAENEILLLADNSFKICIIRPPMVYGAGCKGNFQSLLKLAKKSPVFPKINNKRSMIYIDNLSSFVKLCIDNELYGIYTPQNREYVNTYVMVKIIAKRLNKKIYFSVLLGLAIFLIRPFISIAKKGFGTLIYENMDDFKSDYCVLDNEESFVKSI